MVFIIYFQIFGKQNQNTRLQIAASESVYNPPVRSSDQSIQEVIAAIQRGDQTDANYRLLFDCYYNQVNFFFRRKQLLPEDCEELTQEVFISVFKSIREVRDPARFDGWLFRIALNAFRSFLEHQKAKKRAGVHTAFDVAALEEAGLIVNGFGRTQNDPIKTLLDAETLAQVREVLQNLPDQMRHCMHLRLTEELSYQEIALVMGLSINTIKAHLFQGRKLLAERVKEFSNIKEM